MITQSVLYVLTAGLLILIGFAAVTMKRNLIKILLGFVMINTGVHLLIVAMGFLPGRTAPIIDDASYLSAAGDLAAEARHFVDPIPHALVLTAIVIGVGVTALMLAYAVRLYAVHKTLDVREFGKMKW